MSAKKRPPLSETQIAIMNVVWDRGEITVGELYREFSARRDVARNTVLTMTTRLYEKGWLKRRRRGNAYLYRAAVPREKTLAAMVGSRPHPAVHMLNRELARAREETCDNFVLYQADARSYSSTLLALATGIEEAWLPRPGVGLFAGVWKLEDRVAGLLHGQRRRDTRANKWNVASFAAVLAVLVGVMACIGPAVTANDADRADSGRSTDALPGRAPAVPPKEDGTPLAALLRLNPWLTFDNQDRLIGMDLSSTGATDADLARLAAFPHVEELLLPGTQITDEGMTHLRHLDRLTYLDLSQTKVTRRGLTDLSGLDSLQLIRLEGTAITQDEIDNLGLPGDLALPLEEDELGFGLGGAGGGFFGPENLGGFGGGAGGSFGPDDFGGFEGFFPKEPDDGEFRGEQSGRAAAGADAPGDEEAR
jgi:predicted transcriptional regulator